MPVSFPNDVVDAGCPACEYGPLFRFYRVDPVPAMSNLLVKGRYEALLFPTATLDLAVCPACGFITNLAFDESKIQLSPGYEATQSHSPTFMQFARELASSLVHKHSLQGKTIVEIGCGQGEFLALLAELGGNHCIGFDPIADPANPPAVSRGKVELIPSRFHHDLTAELRFHLLVCRHTLEHIPLPEYLLLPARTAMYCQPHPRPRLVVEVPDTLRILQQGCFWDFFHEHCSYFSEVSLRQSLNTACIELTDMRLEFNRQYLVAEGRALRKIVLQPVEHPILGEVERFIELVRPTLEGWSNRIEQWRREGRRWAIWGAGSKAAGFLATLGIKDVLPVVDINPKKHGSYIPCTGQPVVPPEELCRQPPDVVVIMNPAYQREIAESLEKLGLRPELIALT